VNVLVDTSVWSTALRKRPAVDTRVVDSLRKHIERGHVVLLGVVVQEVLQGFRSDADVTSVAKKLAAFPLLQLAREDYVAAANLHRACARRGIAASTVDCHIASAAIRHKCKLLTVDRDFERIATVTALHLV
jgi:predicted nucleic acid-binding protein